VLARGGGNAAVWQKRRRAIPARSDHPCDVDINDFLVLLAEWDKTCSRADTNEDGIVNINDFLLLLADWGCPDPDAEPFPEDAQECTDR
jgi:hypothetical protein